jgi:hypothetical protein
VQAGTAGAHPQQVVLRALQGPVQGPPQQELQYQKQESQRSRGRVVPQQLPRSWVVAAKVSQGLQVPGPRRQLHQHDQGVKQETPQSPLQPLWVLQRLVRGGLRHPLGLDNSDYSSCRVACRRLQPQGPLAGQGHNLSMLPPHQNLGLLQEDVQDLEEGRVMAAKGQLPDPLCWCFQLVVGQRV